MYWSPSASRPLIVECDVPVAGPTRVALASGAPANPLQTRLFDVVQVAVWASSSVPGADRGRRRLRSASDRTCVVPRTHNSFGDRSFSAAGLRVAYGMLYLQNSDMTSALDSLGANWSRICLSRALNHGALWHIVFLRLRNILTYLPTYVRLRISTG